jgi:hypothetical protein
LCPLKQPRLLKRGGDVLQHVVTRTGQAAGTILWETKRAKDWSVQWIQKLKEDMRACGAAVGILVTMPGALPKDWPAGGAEAENDVTIVTRQVHLQRAVTAGTLCPR